MIQSGQLFPVGIRSHPYWIWLRFYRVIFWWYWGVVHDLQWDYLECVVGVILLLGKVYLPWVWSLVVDMLCLVILGVSWMTCPWIVFAVCVWGGHCVSLFVQLLVGYKAGGNSNRHLSLVLVVGLMMLWSVCLGLIQRCAVVHRMRTMLRVLESWFLHLDVLRRKHKVFQLLCQQ